MRIYKSKLFYLGQLILIVSTGLIAVAQDTIRAKPYLMMGMTEGDLRADGIDAEYDVTGGSPELMGLGGFEFDYRTDGYNFLSQFSYTVMEDTTPKIPSLTYADALAKFENITFTETVGINIYKEGRSYLDFALGGRFTSISIDYETRGAGGETKYSDDALWIDPVVGLYSMSQISDSIYLQLGGDYGGFNVGSKSTWQAVSALNFVISPKASFALGYRAISYDYESGDFKYDIVSHGPTIGFDLNFSS